MLNVKVAHLKLDSSHPVSVASLQELVLRNEGKKEGAQSPIHLTARKTFPDIDYTIERLGQVRVRIDPQPVDEGAALGALHDAKFKTIICETET